ncbi:DNA helicase MCM8-like [Mizuhopecten yessoensis]|uniref:DNA helicase MCM8 n=1 Tax=Mizuhopecten yessoensis TaxID=6573 RepID=A0A210R1Y1_MIZYE|nr:DNA helicase MCM8-like [Mizuhopecten yessoensis]XP_021379155.1 DNA helicase MCM8-like [Mizuhopecten yessoensis]XP_021379163.1 DNA helicase MCM8-like [Mizuhopecten yessoensis]OWF54901.1 DNA helicase MCM8 [Mizuhopecten yessoensis]
MSSQGSNYSNYGQQSQGSNYGNQGRGSQGRGRSSGGGRGNWRGRWRGRGGRYFSHHGNRGGRGANQGGAGPVLMDGPQGGRRPPPMVQTRIEVQSPYKGWRMYFPEEVYCDHSPTVTRIQVFEKYIISWSNSYKWNDVEEKGSFTVEYKELMDDQIILEKLPDLPANLKDMPENILSCLGIAAHQFVTNLRMRESAENEDGTDQPDVSYCVPMIQARVTNFGSPIPLKNLKANYYGKFISIKGTVVRVGNIKPLCTRLAFECNSCGMVQSVSLPDGKYVLPTKCPSQECRSKTFVPRRSSDLTQTIDWQTIRVQEIMGDTQKETGRIPRTIDCELTQDLVDSAVPGDIVTVSGVVKVNSVDEGRGRNKDKCMFLLYLQANSVNNTKGNKSGDTAGLAIDFSIKELYAIEEIQSETNTFRLLVGSVCPSIYGHELVKAGLILGLFGGTQKYTNDKNRIPVRGDPHVLVVGDPGLGKSQMLQSASNIAPRSVYVCGNTTTTSGLTVTLSRDGGSGDFALEAGALVLADQGCCCIDEFDKMGNQHQALLEAMEQQSISVAKAGIVCSLPARTSIIAAANPVGGHYNKSKTVSENLKMGSALLSRFDLVFILLDKPDEEMDSMLSEHVMALHAGKNRSMTRVTARRSGGDDSILLTETDKPLSDRLKVPRGEAFDPIPAQLLRKYVGYARKYVRPKIGKEAATVLQEFYLELRKQHQTQDSTPITTRQLESLIRLTEARARLELREEATKDDANDVIEVMKYSMVDTYSDQFGGLDFRRSQHGSGMSGRSQPKKFVAALQKISEQTYNSIFTIPQMRQISKDIGLNILDFESFISSLNNQGYLLKKGTKVYQLQTADY